MRKPITTYFALATSLVLLGGMLAGCAKPLDETPATAELSVTTVGATEAVLNLHTGRIRGVL